MANEHYFDVADSVRLYINTATSTPNASPDWQEMLNAEDPAWDASKEEITRKPRGGASGGFNLKRGGRKEGTIKFKYSKPIEDAAGGHDVDAIWTLLEDSFWNDSPIQLAFVDRDIQDTDVRGVKMWCEVFKMPRSGTAGDGMDTEFECAPTDYAEGGDLCPPERIGPA